jgi:hypothetical protein
MANKKAPVFEGFICWQPQAWVTSGRFLVFPLLLNHPGIYHARVFSQAGALFRQTLVGVLAESQTADRVSIRFR